MAPLAVSHSVARAVRNARARRSSGCDEPDSRATGAPNRSSTPGSTRTRDSALVTSWIGPTTRSIRG